MKSLPKKFIVCSSLFAILIMPLPSLADVITVQVKGMVCPFCAQGIKKTFGKNENVAQIEVDLEKKLVTIQTKDQSPLTNESIKGIINDAGYDVLSIERKL